MPKTESLPLVNSAIIFNNDSEYAFIKWAEMTKNNPQKAVDELWNMLQDDIQKGKSLDEYRFIQILEKLPQRTLDLLARQILSKYTANVFTYPLNKIALAQIKDELEKERAYKNRMNNFNSITQERIDYLWSALIKAGYVDEGGYVRKYPPWEIPPDVKLPGLRENEEQNVFGLLDGKRMLVFSPKHILVMLYSANNKELLSIKKAEQMTSSPETKIIKREENIQIKQIKFINDEKTELSEDDKAKLNQIAEFIEKMNAFIPGHPIKEIRAGGEWAYSSLEHVIIMDLSLPDYMAALAHEMGHAIFAVLLGGADIDNIISQTSNDPAWQKIYRFSLGCYEMVDDSNWNIKLKDAYGHPFDGPTELFASSVAAFLLHRNETLKAINDKDVPPEMKKLWTMIDLYLRDKIFGGKIITASDQYGGISYIDCLNSVKEEEVEDSLISALDDKKAALNAIKELVKLGRKDEKIIQALLYAMKSKIEGVREIAYDAVGDLNIVDERLKKALLDNLWSGAKSIKKLGLFSEDELICAIEKENSKEWQLELLRRLNIKNARSIEMVTDGLGNRDISVRIEAMLAAVKLGIENEEVNEKISCLLNKLMKKTDESYEIICLFNSMKEEEIVDARLKDFVLKYAELEQKKIKDGKISTAITAPGVCLVFNMDKRAAGLLIKWINSGSGYVNQNVFSAMIKMKVKEPELTEIVMAKLENTADDDVVGITGMMAYLWSAGYTEERFVGYLKNAARSKNELIRLSSMVYLQYIEKSRSNAKKPQSLDRPTRATSFRQQARSVPDIKIILQLQALPARPC